MVMELTIFLIFVIFESHISATATTVGSSFSNEGYTGRFFVTSSPTNETADDDGGVFTSFPFILAVSIACGVVITIILITIVCCCKYRRQPINQKHSTRRHQPLVQTDSGFVTVPVQRMSGPAILQNSLDPQGTPLSVRSSDITRSGSMRYSSPFGTPVDRCSSIRDSSSRDAVSRSSSMRMDSPRMRNAVARSQSARVQTHFRDGSSFITPMIVNTPPRERMSAKDRSSRSSQRRSNRRDDRSSSLLHPDVISRPNRDHDSQDTRSSDDGFTLSSSFGDLQKSGSSYDNLAATSDEERKASLYDNVDTEDETAAGVLKNPTTIEHLQNVKARYLAPPSNKRKSSFTLPLRFTMFQAGHAAQSCDPESEEDIEEDDPDQDYVNVPARKRSKHQIDLHGPSLPERRTKSKRFKFRRPSKTLTLMCKRNATTLSKIEKEVLACVPVYGEQTPGGSPGPKSPLDTFHFPPPPKDVPPVSPALSYINPMYSPTTATPGGDDDQSNFYFSC